ncbi:MAG TPA: hypothetical protein VK914_00615 [bacterium]|jgi:hypothetical protein|nr:hypothetical protein [bacterium]
MECRSCGAKAKFQALVTDYKPMEIWEFEGKEITRYTQPDAGDLEVKLSCLKCGSNDVDKQGFDMDSFQSKKLVTLSDEAWDAKVKA